MIIDEDRRPGAGHGSILSRKLDATLEPVLALCAENLVLAGVAPDVEHGTAPASKAPDEASGAARFDEVLQAQADPRTSSSPPRPSCRPDRSSRR